MLSHLDALQFPDSGSRILNKKRGLASIHLFCV